jgi:hypothetical protein
MPPGGVAHELEKAWVASGAKEGGSAATPERAEGRAPIRRRRIGRPGVSVRREGVGSPDL